LCLLAWDISRQIDRGRRGASGTVDGGGIGAAPAALGFPRKPFIYLRYSAASDFTLITKV